METYDNILKAQGIFKKMVACDNPVAFKKVFSESIYKYTLDEFYPVVVRAELAAALAFCHRERERGREFVFRDYLFNGFGLKPQHMLHLVTQVVADIMDRDVDVVEDIFRSFGFTIENGIVSAHPDAEESKPRKILDFNEARRRKTG